MNKKDIALTVGGILATMILAYMFYSRQQQQAASAAAASQPQQVTGLNNPDFYNFDGTMFDASAQYLYGSQLASLSVPSYSSTVQASTVAAAVDTSATTAGGHDAGSQITDVLGQFFNEYMSGAATAPADFSTLIIPASTIAPGLDASTIPTTAAAATVGLDGSANVPHPANLTETLSTAGVIGGAVSSPSTTPVSVTVPASSQTENLHYNHVLGPATAM